MNPNVCISLTMEHYNFLQKVMDQYKCGFSAAVRKAIEHGHQVESLGYLAVKLTDEANIELAKYMREDEEARQITDDFRPQLEINEAVSRMIVGFPKQRKIAEAHEQQIRSIQRHRGSGHVSTPSQSSNGVVEESQEAIPSYFSESRADQDNQRG